jgi:DNA-3-methyladenine glycosylase II
VEAGAAAAEAAEPAWTHLRAADPVLGGLLDVHGPPALVRIRAGEIGHGPDDHFAALVRAIIGQQVSVAAARAIHRRLVDQFGGVPPTPEALLARDPEELRPAAGLSRAKTVYLRSLAEHVVDGSLDLAALRALDDAEVVRALVAVKGLGEWSAHVFLIFQLGRPDVLAVGDLAIRRAAMLAYGLDAPPDRAALTTLAEPWRPWRTAACRLLWRSLGASPG